jgi:hypothetical protein
LTWINSAERVLHQSHGRDDQHSPKTPDRPFSEPMCSPRLGFFSGGHDLIVSLLIGLSMEKGSPGRYGGRWWGFSTFGRVGTGKVEKRVYGLQGRLHALRETNASEPSEAFAFVAFFDRSRRVQPEKPVTAVTTVTLKVSPPLCALHT